MFTQECLLRNVGEAKMHVMLELTKLGYSPMYLNFENNVGGNKMIQIINLIVLIAVKILICFLQSLH